MWGNWNPISILIIVMLMVMACAKVTSSSSFTLSGGSSVTVQCSGVSDSASGHIVEGPSRSGSPGPPGKMGPQGLPGPQGVLGAQGPPGVPGKSYTEAELRALCQASQILGSVANPTSSCQEIVRQNASSVNGLYYIKDTEGNVFQTYCDMTTAGGGWTLVASVHENNMKGRCTAGDRWSSEQGNNAAHPYGDGLWENRATHGTASSATSDDYKNSGYFALNAQDVMIWQVPNDTPIKNFEASAFFQYYTYNGFLQSYGGNLGSLFADHYNMRNAQFQRFTDNGPSVPVRWKRGSNEELLNLVELNVKNEVDPGFIQFRTINHEGTAFALCPGFKIKSGKANVEHSCIGSVGFAADANYCGDYAARDYEGWSTNVKMITSVVMIFYR